MRLNKYKYQFTKNKLILIGVLVLFVFIGFNFVNYITRPEIDKILETVNYSYLPKEAKNFVKEVYEETGEVILTEKNKEVSVPYLNPNYVYYLTLSDDEKANVSYVPEVYVTDYVMEDEYADNTYPSSYNLGNLNGNNYLSDFKNQENLNICWTIASIENAETYLMLKNNKPFNSNSDVFSPRQMDYATSTDGIIYTFNGNSAQYNWNNYQNGYRPLTSGGNYYMSSIAMANAITLFSENDMSWNTSTKGRKAGEIFDFSKVKYEVNNTVQLAVLEEGSSSETINSYNNKIKDYMMRFGGPFIGTYSPNCSCGFINTDGKPVLKVDDCRNANLSYGHAMQIIGWDDNYSYSYCDSGTTHTNTVNGTCSSGTLVNGKGAWILRNSWGSSSSYKYVYLTYDSTGASVGFITNISSMNERTWDNNYHNNPWNEEQLLNTTYNENVFYINSKKEEKLERIKFFNSTVGGAYSVYVATNDSGYYKVATVNTFEQGIVTVDVSSLNIKVGYPGFKVLIYGENGQSGSRSMSFNKSVSVFTSNLDTTPVIYTYSTGGVVSSDVLSDTNPLYVDGDDTYNFTLTFFPRNIPANANLSYRITNGNNTFNSFGNLSKLYVIDGEGMTYVDGSTTLTYDGFSILNHGYGKTYNFEIIYNGQVVSKFPIKFNGRGSNTQSNLKFNYNDGSGKYYSSKFKDRETIDTRNYVNETNAPGIFNKNRHITSWNTKADGSGVEYSINEINVINDLELYAQWVNGNSYTLRYSCSDDGCKLGNNVPNMTSFTLVYDDSITVLENYYTRNNYKFLYWRYGDNIYYGEEKVKDLGLKKSPFGDEVVSLVAVWQNQSLPHKVTFNSNGGTGSMSSIYMHSSSSQRLKYNLFTRDKYKFIGWNTNADGSGKSYTDGENVLLSSDTTLYAQWVKTDLEISFDSNGGSGVMTSLDASYNSSIKLPNNLFTRLGYTFSYWNTKSDGSGTNYDNLATVTVKDDLKLYAIWVPNNYTVIFDNNGGTGTMSNQNVVYDKEFILNQNAFGKKNYIFKGWNTKSDGSGTSYTDKQKVSNLVASGSITLYAIWRYDADFEIKEYTVVDSDDYIDKIPINTSLDDYKKNIIVGDGYRFEIDLGNKKNIFTGSKLKIYKGSELIVEYTNIVRGDVNRDGSISALDYVKVKNHIMKSSIISDFDMLLAADANSDNGISALDYVRIKNIILGGSN